jgi:hypothetical protein
MQNQEIMMKTKKTKNKMKRERIQKNNKVNDITCKKFVNVF